MFKRWYYVVCMGCLLYWVLVHCWCVCNCVRISGVVVYPFMYVGDVCQCCDVCFCMICVLFRYFFLGDVCCNGM